MSKKPVIERTVDQSKLALKKKVRMFYDIQRMRLQNEGRVTRKPAHAPIELTEYDKTVLEQRKNDLLKVEKEALKDVQEHLKSIAFYRDVLSDKKRYRGIGPTMAGVILAEFKIETHDTASKMFAFAGLRPMPAFRCRECHTVVKEDGGMFTHPKHATCKYSSVTATVPREDTYASGQAQRPVKGEKNCYNAFLRTKLLGVLAPVMLQVNSPWRKHYDDYKHRKQTAGWGRDDGHRHQAALRYMIKMLLLDIYLEWRKYENLPVRPSYHEEKQGGHGFGAKLSGNHPTTIDPEVQAELELLE